MGAGIIGGAIGAVSGLAGSIGALIGSAKDKKESNKINPEYKPYEISPYAKNNLALAKARLGSKSAAVTMAETGIQKNQAAAGYNAEKSASDGSQLLAAGGAIQAQADNAETNLAGAQEQFTQQNLQNLNQANAGMTNELDKQYQDNLQKYMTDLNLKMAYRNASRQGFSNAMAGLAGVGGGMANGAFGTGLQGVLGK